MWMGRAFLCVSSALTEQANNLTSPEVTKVGGVENFRLHLKPSLARPTSLNLHPEFFCFHSVFTRIFSLSSHLFCGLQGSACARLVWSPPPPTAYFLSAEAVSRVPSHRLVGQSSGRTSKWDS